MPIDPVISLALAVESNPGIYALLLGAGISRAAGILTGGEIQADLIQRIAKTIGEDPGDDAVGWFERRYQLKPDYSSILNQLGRTRAERQSLLRRYFEPDEHEKAKGLKLPTKAHHAIADLMANGYIRVVLTTNFDRLLEQALSSRAIQPVVWTPSNIAGAEPPTHAKNTIIKIHGDYLDHRLKNTVEELSKYEPRLKRYLHRVFDEFGLIVCGWSAESDVAMRDAILKTKTRRYSIFWSSRSDFGEKAKEIIANRKAQLIVTPSADDFFRGLKEKVNILRRFPETNAVDIEVAIRRAKHLVAEPSGNVELRDLLISETEAFASLLATDNRFDLSSPDLSDGSQRTRLKDYEQSAERLAKILAVGAFHLGPNSDAMSLLYPLERLAAPLYPPGNEIWERLARYPAMLCLYNLGVAATAARNAPLLRGILTLPVRPGVVDLGYSPVVEVLNPDGVLPDSGFVPEFGKLHSEYLADAIKNIVRGIVPDARRFRENFDLFEYAHWFFESVLPDGTTPKYVARNFSQWVTPELWLPSRLQIGASNDPRCLFLRKVIGHEPPGLSAKQEAAHRVLANQGG